MSDGHSVVATFLSAHVFDGGIHDLVVRLKYEGDKRCARHIAEQIYLDFPDIARAQCLTWIPTLRERRERRGFDHAELITRHISSLANVKVVPALRRTSTGHQTGKGRYERETGVCFVAHPRCRGRRVVVIDDVCTTGSTFRAAAMALAEVGASSLTCISGAYVP